MRGTYYGVHNANPKALRTHTLNSRERKCDELIVTEVSLGVLWWCDHFQLGRGIAECLKLSSWKYIQVDTRRDSNTRGATPPQKKSSGIMNLDSKF